MSENLLTYTKGGTEASKITVTASRATATNLEQSDQAYVYKDFGVDYFSGNFSHQADCRIISSNSAAASEIWAMSNVVAGSYPTRTGNYPSIMIRVGRSAGGSLYLLLAEHHNGSLYYDEYTPTLNTTYYLTIERDVSVPSYGQLDCFIYSAATRKVGDLLDTLSLPLHVDTDFRYLYAARSIDGVAGPGTIITCWGENYFLGNEALLGGGFGSSRVLME